MSIATIPEVLDALRTVLEATGCEVYHYVPDNPVLPCICLYPELWPYAVDQEAVIVALCLAGTTDSDDAQTKLLEWVSDQGDSSIVAAIDADNALGGIASVLPDRLRSWGIATDLSGKRILQAELVFNVLRNER